MKIKDYFMPKSNVYTGDYAHIKTKITHYTYDENELIITDSFEKEVGKKHYIQVVGLNEVAVIETIKQHFKVDPLTLEDVFNVKQRNKLELKDDSLFGAMHIEFLEHRIVKDDYLSFLLFEDAIITFHETEPTYLLPLKTILADNLETRTKSVDYLFFQIIDIITDNHLDLYEHLEMETSLFEEEILETKQISQEQFYMIRKQMLKLKNNISPVLDQFQKVLSKESKLFQKANLGYFEDLKDHLARLDDHLNQSRELMRHLLDLIINNQSNRMNKIMTTLTLFSAIFIPLSFLTGFFGMNFVHFDILSYENAVLVFTGVCFGLALVMFILFKKMKWF